MLSAYSHMFIKYTQMGGEMMYPSQQNGTDIFRSKDVSGNMYESREIKNVSKAYYCSKKKYFVHI